MKPLLGIVAGARDTRRGTKKALTNVGLAIGGLGLAAWAAWLYSNRTTGKLATTLRDLGKNEDTKKSAMERATEDDRHKVLSAFPAFVTLLHGDQLVAAVCAVPACARLITLEQAVALCGARSEAEYAFVLDQKAALPKKVTSNHAGSGAALGKIGAAYSSTGTSSAEYLLKAAAETDEGARALEHYLRFRSYHVFDPTSYAHALASLRNRDPDVRLGLLRALSSHAGITFSQAATYSEAECDQDDLARTGHVAEAILLNTVCPSQKAITLNAQNAAEFWRVQFVRAARAPHMPDKDASDGVGSICRSRSARHAARRVRYRQV